MYKLIVRPLLFLFDPETIHTFTFYLLRILRFFPPFYGLVRRRYWVKHEVLEKNIMGLHFKNRVGLAAGFDKNAQLFNQLHQFGFGFIEIGTLTPRAQKGNPKKRLFRLSTDKALINRMGFNNRGVLNAVKRLKKNKGVLIGGNIGKNKNTPNSDALRDYQFAFENLFPWVDYFVVNVSSPNTPGLRALQDKEPLTHLLTNLMRLNRVKFTEKPILLKIAPDLNEKQLLDVIEIVENTGLAGVIATNTTINRNGLQSDNQNEPGGLSGKPLKERSTRVIQFLAQNRKKPFCIIGVGGISSAGDALDKLEAGADLLQLYTGFVYEGPALIKKINQELILYYSGKNKSG